WRWNDRSRRWSFIRCLPRYVARSLDVTPCSQGTVASLGDILVAGRRRRDVGSLAPLGGSGIGGSCSLSRDVDTLGVAGFLCRLVGPWAAGRRIGVRRRG